jgi:hypothetical protein
MSFKAPHFLFLVLFSLLISSYGFGEVGARVVNFFGYDDSIELSNESCTVKLTPSVGGKVMSYQLNGKEALFVIPEEAGFRYDPNSTERFTSSGGRFDFGLELEVPSRTALWIGPWEGKITGHRQATLTSPPHDATGVQVVREFTLADKGSHLSCKQTLINISDRTLSYSHWGRTFGESDGIVVIPLSDWSRYKYHYVWMEDRSLVNIAPEDPHISIRDNCLVITGAPKYAKLGMDSKEGWLGYLMPHDLLFVKQYPVFPDRKYAERVPMTISIWYKDNFHKDQSVTELEPIGPQEIMAPGERSSFTEEWFLVEHPFPADREQLDVPAVVEASKTVLRAD